MEKDEDFWKVSKIKGVAGRIATSLGRFPILKNPGMNVLMISSRDRWQVVRILTVELSKVLGVTGIKS